VSSSETPSPDLSLGEIAARVGGTVTGDPSLRIRGVGDLWSAQAGDISFVADRTYVEALRQSGASAVLAPPGLAIDRPTVVVEKPELAFTQVLRLFAPPWPCPPPGVHPTAVVETDLPPSVAVGAHAYVGPRTRVGERTAIFANVFIGPDCQVGEDCVLWPGVVVRERTTIGRRVIIHPNATLGADGFGYQFTDGRHEKVPHLGTVTIEDDVEIGAGVCIDRAKAGKTVVGAGTKIDNLVQIGHNVKIGRNVILVAHVGIGGSTTLGDYVVLGGKVGVNDHVHLGDRMQAAACSCISKDIEPGLVVNGIPALEVREYMRQQALVRRLPKLQEKVAELTKQVHELKQPIHDLQTRRT